MHLHRNVHFLRILPTTHVSRFSRLILSAEPGLILENIVGKICQIAGCHRWLRSLILDEGKSEKGEIIPIVGHKNYLPKDFAFTSVSIFACIHTYISGGVICQRKFVLFTLTVKYWDNSMLATSSNVMSPPLFCILKGKTKTTGYKN